MAKFLKGIHGAYHGKVGNVVGSNWREVDYVRSLPKPSKKPATEDQLSQRARFGLAVSFLSPINDLLKLGFSDKQQGKSTGYNRALQHLINHGIRGDYPEYEINYEGVVIARGGLSNLMGVAWEETDPKNVEVSWLPETNKFNAFVDDSVILLFYNIERSFFSILEDGTRGDGSLAFTLPDVYEGDHIVGWVFTGHRDGVKTSSSFYLGELQIS